MPNLHNLQLFLLPHTEESSRLLTTSARLYFLAGPRLIAYLTSTYHQITHGSSILGCGEPQVPDRISHEVGERKSPEKRAADFESQLVSIVAEALPHPVTRANEERISAHADRNDDPLVLRTTIVSESSPSTIPPPNAPEAVPRRIYFLAYFTNGCGHDTGVHLCLRGFPCEGSLGGPLGVKGGGKGPWWSRKRVGVWRPIKEREIVISRAAGGTPIHS